MLRRSYLFSGILMISVLSNLVRAEKTEQQFGKDFFLHDGDVYVIYGDSITDNSVYPRLLENYVLTRFPSWHMTFYNYGWGGDVSRNIFRVERDVLPIKPTVFTENMGMNDGGYSAISETTVKLYSDAYHSMIPLLKKCNPDMRIALISAVPFENQPNTHAADGAYPQTLRYLAGIKKQIAREYNLSFIDLFSEYAKIIGYGKIIYPDFVLTADGVHPNPIGQTIMGMIMLKGMNAPAEIATLNIEVADKSLKATLESRCQVKNLKLSSEGVVSFDRLAESLPCPIEPADEKAIRFLEIANFANEINRDMLKVTGLSGKAYVLKINGEQIATYTASELADGVNITEPMKGPIWKQAMSVAEATLERQQAHYRKWRNIWLKDQTNMTQGQYDLSNKAEIDKLDTIAAAAIKKQHELNQPQWMTFTLEPVSEKPSTLPKPVTLYSASAIKPPKMEPLDWTKKDVKTIDLRKVVNRAFADETAGDGKGGWSDQGSKQDLSALPVGKQTFTGIPFDIIDPASNNDKSMVVLSLRPEQKNVAANVTIPVEHKASILTFLHTGAWFPSSEKPVKVEFIYTGDIKASTTLVAGCHFADWWSQPQYLSGGIIAWTGKANGYPISVMYTPILNPRPDLPIESIKISLEDGSNSIYGLIAISYLE